MSSVARGSGRRGIVLVLLSGLVALLLFLALLFLRISSLSGRAGDGRSEEGCARLASSSGMEYASSRLAAEARIPSQATSFNRGDDWTFREGAAGKLAGAFNPSYSHGEPWLDAGADDGVYAPPADVFQPSCDHNGDGRMTAHSGRLRGSAGTAFSLRIHASDAKIPLSGCWVYAANSLGSLVLRPGHPRMWTVPSGNLSGGSSTEGEPVRVCWLGYDLMTAAPQGGYREWRDVEGALLGSRLGYTSADLETLRPFLAPLFGADLLGGALRVRGAPVNLAVAPREVLGAVWMNLAAKPKTAAWPREADPLSWDVPCTRTGPASLPTTLRYKDDPLLAIWPDEATALADRVIALRKMGPFTWKSLYETLLAGAHQPQPTLGFADPIFRRDCEDLSAFPVNRRIWAQAKADLAFQAIVGASCPGGDGFGAWATWGIDRDPSTPDPDLWMRVGFLQVGLLPEPTAYAPGAAFSPTWADPFKPYKTLSSASTIGCVIAPPSLFDVESLARAGRGASAEARGTLRVAERLEIASQEAFENRTSWQAGMLSGFGIGVAEEGGAIRAVQESRHDFRLPAGQVWKSPQVTTLPMLNLWSYNVPAETVYTTLYGAVALGTVERGVQSASLYWPFSTEDFDGIPPSTGTPGNATTLIGNAPPGSYPAQPECWSLPAPGAGYYLPPTSNSFYKFWPGPFRFLACLPGATPPANFESVTSFRYGPGKTSSHPGRFGTGGIFRNRFTQFQWPGFHYRDNDLATPDPPLPSSSADRFSIECWMGPSSEVCIGGGKLLTSTDYMKGSPFNPSGGIFPYPDYFMIGTSRESVNGLSGTVYWIASDWYGWNATVSLPQGGRVRSRARFFVRDKVPARGTAPSSIHHVVLGMRYRKELKPGGIAPGAITDYRWWTELRLVVDGESSFDYVDRATLVSAGNPAVWSWSGWQPPGGSSEMLAPFDGLLMVQPGDSITQAIWSFADGNYAYNTTFERLWIDEVDELRFYDKDLTEVGGPTPQELFALDRYARRGTYTSPVYLFRDTEARLRESAAVAPSPAGMEGGIRIFLDGYAGSAGPLLWTREILQSGLPADLGGEAPVGAFRYRVSFDYPTASYPKSLNDTPVFESIWVSFRRKGSASAWTAWSRR